MGLVKRRLCLRAEARRRGGMRQSGAWRCRAAGRLSVMPAGFDLILPCDTMFICIKHLCWLGNGKWSDALPTAVFALTGCRWVAIELAEDLPGLCRKTCQISAGSLFFGGIWEQVHNPGSICGGFATIESRAGSQSPQAQSEGIGGPDQRHRTGCQSGTLRRRLPAGFDLAP